MGSGLQTARTRLLGLLLFLVVLTSLSALLYLAVAWLYPAGDIAVYTGLAAGLTIGYIGIALLLAHRTFETAANLRPANPEVAKEAHLIELARAVATKAGVPWPKVYLQRGQEINAFAYGLSHSSALIGTTQGALDHLDEDELEAVLAHEIAHIKHHDVVETTAGLAILAGLGIGLAGLWSMVHTLAEATWRTGVGRKRLGPLLAVVPLLLMVLVGLTRLLGWVWSRLGEIAYFAHARQKEYLADATSAQLTGKPQALIGALTKMQAHPAHRKPRSAVLAAAYIHPWEEDDAGSGLFASHPPLKKRLARLRGMMAEKEM